MFICTNQPLITSFYIKKLPFCRISEESALIRTFLCNERVRVNLEIYLHLLNDRKSVHDRPTIFFLYFTFDFIFKCFQFKVYY